MAAAAVAFFSSSFSSSRSHSKLCRYIFIFFFFIFVFLLLGGKSRRRARIGCPSRRRAADGGVSVPSGARSGRRAARAGRGGARSGRGRAAAGGGAGGGAGGRAAVPPAEPGPRRAAPAASPRPRNAVRAGGTGASPGASAPAEPRSGSVGRSPARGQARSRLARRPPLQLRVTARARSAAAQPGAGSARRRVRGESGPGALPSLHVWGCSSLNSPRMSPKSIPITSC